MKEEAAGSFFAITLSFHAKSSCLLDWHYHQKIGRKRNRLIPFSNKVSLSSNLKFPPHHFDEMVNNGIAVVCSIPFVTHEHIPGMFCQFSFTTGR
jgi:hypothetical protein